MHNLKLKDNNGYGNMFRSKATEPFCVPKVWSTVGPVPVAGVGPL